MSQDHAISWGQIEFAGLDLPDTDYAFQVMSEGSNFGNPEPLWEIAKSLLTDGSNAVFQGWDDRTIVLRFQISAPLGIAGPALEEAEEILMLAAQEKKPAPLVYVPPATDAAMSVYDVTSATLERDTSDGWDLDEEMREARHWLLTLRCRPFARPESTVVVPALPIPVTPSPPVFQTIDECSALTGWSKAASSALWTEQTFGISSGAVRFTGNIAPKAPASAVYLTRTGSISSGGLPYIALDVSALWKWTGSNPRWVLQMGPRATTPGLEPVAIHTLGGGVFRVFFHVPSATANEMTLACRMDPNPFKYRAGAEVKIHNVARTDSLAVDGSNGRQVSRTAVVIGSAPTQAQIRLYSAAVLGRDALVYTSRNTDWQPSLRTWWVTDSTSPVEPDAAMISGGRNTLAGLTVFRFPAAAITEGTYALLARLRVTTAGVIGWQARIVSSSGADTLGSSVVISGSTEVAANSTYEVTSIGALPLQVVPVEGDQMIELILTGTSNMSLDEAWLFSLTDGSLTWVRDTSLSIKHLEIRSAEIGSPRPSVYASTEESGANMVCVDWACKSFGGHRFDPGEMQVFTITPGAPQASSELEFYPRYHSHVSGKRASVA